MREVRSTSPGSFSRRRASSARTSALVERRFMAFKMPSLMC